ncbi:HNH endonuclease [Halomarina rubra]|uniref:HNH endonuclease n=1 Tax=Halomarina rubra TaxID=2071873 RepID=A0ABD6API9_9EURY|nr:HNH endonuclease [Halomarina rubra]
MSRWRAVVRRELARFRAETGYDVVGRQEFLDQSLSVFRDEFPHNDHPGQKVSQVLQQLRDRNEVTFLDPGTYRLHDLHLDSADEVTTAHEDEPRYTASEYETTVGARSMPAAFRGAILRRYDATCPVSGVDHPRLLDVAHVVPWSADVDRRTDPGNVLALSKTHHAAFDAGQFTLDTDDRLHVSPEFETSSEHLRRTLLDRDGDRLDLPTGALGPDCVERHNESLSWW